MPSTSSPPERWQTDVVGARIGAQVVDVVIQTVQIVAVTVVLGLALPIGPEPAVGVALLTLPFHGGLLEGYWNGQTVGKKLFGIRVVHERGGPCYVGQAFVRNVPAIVMPGWLPYLVALAAMAASDKRQRLFDELAGTVVVRA